jgi:hypothetical protein
MIKKNIALPVFIIICTLVLSMSIVYAKNVSQDLGFKDVTFSSVDKDFCKDCHGTSLADTHHDSAKAQAGECVFCHSVSKDNGSLGVVVKRDCTKCHLESPHHKTEAALDNDCTSCHDTPGLSDYSTDTVSYGVSKVTPAVSNCGRCHGEGKDGDINIVGYKQTHHQITLENCNVCHMDTDPKTVNIRTCERCHNVASIHRVADHVDPENCVVCHITK